MRENISVKILSCHTQLQDSTMIQETPQIDANGIAPTFSVWHNSFTMRDQPEAGGDADDADDASDTVANSDSDEEKPSTGGKAPRVNTVHWEPQRRSPGGCVLSVSDVNLILSS
jgi:hypothetical protein